MKLQVLLEDHPVGTLTLRTEERIRFTFADDYVSDPNRPVLSQSFLQADGQLIEDVPGIRTKLPPWFSNLLPEGPLLDYISRKANINKAREFHLLAFLGSDLPGAVRVIGEGVLPGETEPPDEDPSKRDGPLRFSLAGVQLKFSALLNDHGGMTVPASGLGGDWIVKLPSSSFRFVPENEAAMLTLAAKAGIPVPEHRLIPIDAIEGLPENFGNAGGKNALAVRRFDRGPEGKRIHMEDLAQVSKIFPDDKYEGVGSAKIAETFARVIGHEAAQDFIARLTFITLTGNGDMHLKNWSLLYPDGRKPILSPAYDLVSTVPYLDNDKLALNIADEKSFLKITMEKFKRLAGKAGLAERQTLSTVERVTDAVLSAWPEVRRSSALPDEVANMIDAHMGKLPLVHEVRSPHVAKGQTSIIQEKEAGLPLPEAAKASGYILSATLTKLPDLPRTGKKELPKGANPQTPEKLEGR